MPRMGKRARGRKNPDIPRVYIRELRKDQALTLVDLLSRVETFGVVLTEASLSRIERSKQPVDTPTLSAIAQALDTTITALLTGITAGPDSITHTWERIPDAKRPDLKRMLDAVAESSHPSFQHRTETPPPARRRSKR